MTGESKKSVLRRMTAESMEPAGAPSVAGVLRRALERAAETNPRLALEVTGLSHVQCLQEDLGRHLPDAALLAVLEGAAPGFVAVENAVLSGIVEYLTIGTVLKGKPATRPPSRVDAALMAPLIDATLERLTKALVDAGGEGPGQSLAFGAMISEPRSLILALGEGQYHLFDLAVSLKGGARKGRILFGFPEYQSHEADILEAPAESEGTKALRQGVMLSPVVFDAVLANVSLPLSRLQTLKPGDLVPLPSGAQRQARLEVATKEHVIPVVLGHLNGFRAIRLKAAGQGRVQETEATSAAEAPLDADAEGAPKDTKRSKTRDNAKSASRSEAGKPGDQKVDPGDGLDDFEVESDLVDPGALPETV